MNVSQNTNNLFNRLLKVKQDIALELSAAQHRPEGWLPRTIFVEEDEYEAGFSTYILEEIYPDGTCEVRTAPTAKSTFRMNLTEINVDWLLLVLRLYAEMCAEQGLEDTVRRCDSCGSPMKEGYYLAGEYACSQGCAIALYDGDWQQFQTDLSKADTDEGECYYTEWESFDSEI